jgi:hypothetical protein
LVSTTFTRPCFLAPACGDSRKRFKEACEAFAKYYRKKKLDPAERHQNKCKEYYLEHKQDIHDQAKQRRDKKKLDTVKAKLDLMDTEHLFNDLKV